MAAQLPMPLGVEEYGVAGWLAGAPVEVIESPATGLPLPAFSEIVLEGEVAPYKDGEPPKEGPFGEWPGYYADTTVGEVPVMEVKRIYYRNDPIMLGAPPLKPPNNFISLPLGAEVIHYLRLQIFELAFNAGLVLLVEGERFSFGRRLDLCGHFLLQKLHRADAPLFGFGLKQPGVDL